MKPFNCEQIKLLVLKTVLETIYLSANKTIRARNNTWNHLSVCKQMSFGSFKTVTYTQFVYKPCMFNAYVLTGFSIE